MARSQWGFIIPPVPEQAMHFPLMMEQLSGVTIGTSLAEPALNRVTVNHFQSAQLGWVTYLGFLALVSVSLGVLNLLPIPLLDGGHLV